jgi:WD40 repeat protein
MFTLMVSAPLLAFKPKPSFYDLVAISPDGHWALSAVWDYDVSRRKVKLWDAAKGKFIRTLEEQTGYHFISRISARWIRGAGSKMGCGPWPLVKLGDDGTGLRTHILPLEKRADSVPAIAFLPSSDTTLTLWDVVTTQPIRTFDGQGQYVFRCFLARWSRSTGGGGSDQL